MVNDGSYRKASYPDMLLLVDILLKRCRFTNFARNTKCIHCREHRPKRQLNAREWECPS
ncbi:P-type ATPase [Artemisia annua]|uniref:P-type ATPase n=1 Tax=Artemisia annua TaxID=35608 RepID=A0A2U1LTR5_ARTAN|nr:P-type ATPase [Artemisia annua]